MNKKIIGIVIAVIVVILIIIGAVLIIRDLKQDQVLKNEISRISKLDLSKDNINTSIKTKGDYAIVEKTIKNYLNEYSILVKKVTRVMENEKLATLLTSSNYKNDGPEFENSKKYINELKDEFNNNIEKMIELSKEENILKEIEDKGLNQEYIALYKDLMLGTNVTEDLKNVIDQLQEAKDLINNRLDAIEDIIDFLNKHKNSWRINDNDELEFTAEELLEEYNQKINKIV